MIRVTINGKEYEFESASTVEDYLEMKDLLNRSIAVALNGTVLRREEFASATLNDGDHMEIVRPVGGG
ncbi:MAG: sulfur carrier protein ThiS [Dehalococcoidia bacterium]